MKLQYRIKGEERWSDIDESINESHHDHREPWRSAETGAREWLLRKYENTSWAVDDGATTTVEVMTNHKLLPGNRFRMFEVRLELDRSPTFVVFGKTKEVTP